MYIYIHIYDICFLFPTPAISSAKPVGGMTMFNGFYSLNFRFKTSSRCCPDWEMHAGM